MTCKARQHSDQMICEACGLQWDVNDPDPPECNPVQVAIHGDTDPKSAGRLAIAAIRQHLEERP